jgi:hypothetical protein
MRGERRIRIGSEPVANAVLELGWHEGIGHLHFALLIALSAAGSVTLFAVATVAWRRRRSRPYLLLTGALAALVLRPIAATSLVLGVLPVGYHHVVEHVLDVVIAACLLTAIYTVPEPKVEQIDDEQTADFETND